MVNQSLLTSALVCAERTDAVPELVRPTFAAPIQSRHSRRYKRYSQAVKRPLCSRKESLGVRAVTAKSLTFGDADLHIETATIMFVDVVESAKLIEADEVTAVRRLIKLLQRCTHEAVSYNGNVLERRGDGMLIRFTNARDACAFALRCHALAQDESCIASPAVPIQFRVGINEDAVLTDGEAFFGAALNRAARVAALALPGTTQVVQRVREQLAEGIDARFEDLGLAHVKHEAAPLRTYSAVPTRSGVAAPLTTEFEELRARIAVLAPEIEEGSAADLRLQQVYCNSLVSLLSRSLALRVVSKESMSALIGRANALDIAGEFLQCDYVISSRMAVNANSCALYVELYRNRPRSMLWQSAFSVSRAALLEPDCDAVAAVAAKALEVAAAQQLTLLNYERLPNIESQGLLMAGVSLLHRQHKVDFGRAKDIFEHLSERHPKNPLPYTWLATWRVFNVTQSWFSDFDTESRIAVNYAERALELNADAPLAHSVRGLVATNLERQFDLAERHFESALKVDDCDAMAWLHRGVSNAFVGEGEVAVKYTSEARRLSPLDPWSYYFDSLAASAAFAAGDYQLAIDCGLASLRANRFHLSTLRVLAMAYAELGDQKSACAYLDRVLLVEPTLTVSRYLQRSPSAGSPMALKCANALRKAGLNE